MAAGRTPGGFGSTLREARERRGVSLRQIANATKISVSALEALERNDISRLPGGIFSRAFVRSYAVEVGLDPERTIDDFIAQFPHDSVTAGHPAAAPQDDGEAVESDRRIASGAVRLLAISLPIALVVLYLTTVGLPSALRNRRPADVAAPAPAATAAAVPAPVAVPPPSSPVPASPAPPPPPILPAAPQRLTVSMEALVSCWVSITADGDHLFARQLRAGERQTVEAVREVVLTVADAAALRVSLNGAAARPLGQPGEVVTRRLTPSNYKDYVASR